MAARPIWSGTLSFGLLNIPVSLMSGEKRTDIHFRMLDSRDNSPIRFERVNAETGEEVPWKEIVKAFEYDKGSYVVLQPEDIKSAAPESHNAVEVEAFVDASELGPRYFEKPYVLVPGKKAEKGYVLLRETLVKTGKIGIARVVIRTRENLAAVIPEGNALILVMMRFPQELIDTDEYRIPEGSHSDYRITPKELQMAEQLIESMSGAFSPADYKDEFRARLHDVIEKRMKQQGVVTPDVEDDEPADATTNVVDFMALLQKSIAGKTRTPAAKATKADAKTTAKSPAKKAPAKKAPAKKAPAKKAPARKAAKKAAPARKRA